MTRFRLFGGLDRRVEKKASITVKMAEAKVGISSQTLVSNGKPAAKLPQYIAAIVATLGGFCFGTTLAWTSPVESRLNELDFSISADEFAWVGAYVAIGAIIGSAAVGGMVDTFGRKKTIIILAAPMLIGWLLIIFSQNIFMVYFGRLISGFSTGGFSVVVPLFTSEISENEIRGTLGTYFQLQLTIGILVTYILGMFCTIKWITIICAIAPVVLAVTMLFIPESPVYYLKKFRMDDARRSLQFFRGSHFDVEPELQEKKQLLDQMEAERVPFTQAFSTTPAKKGMVIGLGVMLFQQFSGVNAVIFYAKSIFEIANPDMDSSISAIIVAAVMVFMTWVATLVVDRAGRRPLLLLSAAIMAVSTAALGVFFYLRKVNPDLAKSISFLPIGSLCLFIIVFSLGFGPIPWMFISEIFPSQIKGTACSIACLFNWACVFCVTKFYSNLLTIFGPYGTFWIFAGISVLGTVFTLILVPETKGKSMEEIQRELGATSQKTTDLSLETGRKT